MHKFIKHLKQPVISTLIKRSLYLSVLFGSLFLLNGCGKRKPPQPPAERVPQRVAVTGTQLGDQIRLVWQMPARNASDKSTLNINRADIYRLAEPLDAPLGLTEEEFAARSTLIASVPLSDTDFGLKEKSYTDVLRFAGQAARLRYAVRFVNASGQKAAFSNFLIIEPSPRIALGPKALGAVISQDSISLAWEPPEANVDGSAPPNILGYNVYRSEAAEAFRRLNENPLQDPSYADPFFKFGSNYRYFVRTVSIGSGGQQVESLNSNVLELKPVDTFPPGPPDALTIAAAPNSISIFYAVNPEKDIEGYRVYRSEDPDLPLEQWTMLTEEPIKANTYVDRSVVSGRNYYYYVRAIDTAGNISAPSEVVSETAF